MKKTFIFYFLCLAFLILLFFTGKSPDTVVLNKFSPMNVILETKINSKDDIIIKVNDAYYDAPNSYNTLNRTIKENVKTLDIMIKEGFDNEIKSIVIFNGLKTFYYKDFSEFKKIDTILCPDGVCSNYSKYKVPNEVKHVKNSVSYNLTSYLNSFSCLVLSVFTMGISALLLIFIIFYFVNNEIKHPFKNPYLIASLIFILALLLRFNGIFYYLPWLDEYFALEFSNPLGGIKSLFADPGNPPLFYFLFRIWLYIFDVSNFSTKLFPFVISIFSLLSIFWVLKKEFNLKAANIGLLMTAVNIPLIYFSNECRSYILQIALTPVVVYFLFKIFKTNKLKYYFAYGVIVALVSNLHYYEILFIVSNFVFAIFYFLKNNRKKDLLKFFLANVLGVVFFLPFFFITSINQAALNSSFNTWLPECNFSEIKNCAFYLFGGAFSLILSLVLFKFAKEEKLYASYFLFAIFFTFFQAILISLLFKPILYQRYLVLLIPLLIMYYAALFSGFKQKFAPVIFAILLIFIQNNTIEKDNRKKGVSDIPLVISSEYYNKNHPDKNIYIISALSNTMLLSEHKKYIIKDAIYTASSIEDIENNIKNTKNNSIIFTEIIPENLNPGENYTCYCNIEADLCLWKIEK